MASVSYKTFIRISVTSFGKALRDVEEIIFAQEKSINSLRNNVGDTLRNTNLKVNVQF